MKPLTMDELFKALLEAGSMGYSNKEEMLFDEEAFKVLGYYPNWDTMRTQ